MTDTSITRRATVTVAGAVLFAANGLLVFWRAFGAGQGLGLMLHGVPMLAGIAGALLAIRAVLGVYREPRHRTGRWLLLAGLLPIAGILIPYLVLYGLMLLGSAAS